MHKVLKVTGLALATLFRLGGSVQAADMSKQVKARQAVMVLRGYYMGQLAAMAKGKMAYDAKLASSAANSMVALATSVDGSTMYPQGSGTDKLGDATRSRPEIWSTYPKVAEAGKAHVMAAQNMAQVAGNGLAALQGAIGGLGKTCGGCHKPFRVKK